MMNPKLQVLDSRPFIGSKHFDQSRDFYVALGWQVLYDSSNIRLLELDEQRFYLQNYYQKGWCDNTMLFFSVSSVDDWFAHVKRVFSENAFSGIARISEEIANEEYGRVFYVWDPGGALLHIAQMHND